MGRCYFDSVAKRLRRIITKNLRRSGYSLERLSSPVETDNPREVLCTPPLPRELLIRISSGQLFARKATEARVEALKTYMELGRESAHLCLSQWYESYVPSTVAEYYEIPSTNWFSRLPTIQATPPWSNRSPEEAMRFKALLTIEEAKEHGFRLTASDGWKQHGPVSPQLVQLELQRLISVFESISKNGFIPSPENRLRGRLYLTGNDFRIEVLHGLHRLAAVLALGLSEITVTVDLSQPVVRRSEVSFWPNVRSSLFDIPSALAIFDRGFVGTT